MQAATRQVSRHIISSSRCFRRHAGTAASIKPIPATPHSFNRISIDEFRQCAFSAETPLLLPGNGEDGLPTISKWFTAGRSSDKSDERVPRSNVPYLGRGDLCWLNYEFTANSLTRETFERFRKWALGRSALLDAVLGSVLGPELGSERAGSQDPEFIRFAAPLELLLAADQFNDPAAGNGSPAPLTGLYVAQTPIRDLPSRLQTDLPTPSLVQRSGRGDVYDSSVWLGLEPTYTPLHRDPNPNLFVQLCDSKTVRVLPPAAGAALYGAVRTAAGHHAGRGRIRDHEMMQEPESSILMDSVWGGPKSQFNQALDNLGDQTDILEAKVNPGDALFIPLGWWHSVRSWNGDGRMNGSVNWWFR